MDLLPFKDGPRNQSSCVTVKPGMVVLPQIAWLTPDEAQKYGEALIQAAQIAKEENKADTSS